MAVTHVSRLLRATQSGCHAVFRRGDGAAVQTLCLPKLRHIPGLSILLSACFPLAYKVQEADFHFLLAVLVMLSPAARAHQTLVLGVLSDVTHVMS
jgi:hypothetical protein